MESLVYYYSRLKFLMDVSRVVGNIVKIIGDREDIELFYKIYGDIFLLLLVFD